MAKTGRQSFEKRQRELNKKAKRQEKLERRADRKKEKDKTGSDEITDFDEVAAENTETETV